MTDILDRYLAEISDHRKREFVGGYLSLDDNYLFPLLGDRLTFGLRDDWQVESAPPEEQVVEKGRLWFEEARSKLLEMSDDARRHDPQLEDNISRVQTVTDGLNASDDECPAPVLILAILPVNEGFFEA